MAAKLAVDLAASELANEALGLGLDTEKMLGTLAGLESENPTQGLAQRAHEAFMEYVAEHADRFESPTVGSEVGKVLRDDRGEIEAVLVLPEPFKRLMRELGFESPLNVLDSWRRTELLVHDKEKYTVKRKLNDVTVRVHCVLATPPGPKRPSGSSPVRSPSPTRPRKIFPG